MKAKKQLGLAQVQVQAATRCPLWRSTAPTSQPKPQRWANELPQLAVSLRIELSWKLKESLMHTACKEIVSPVAMRAHFLKGQVSSYVSLPYEQHDHVT